VTGDLEPVLAIPVIVTVYVDPAVSPTIVAPLLPVERVDEEPPETDFHETSYLLYLSPKGSVQTRQATCFSLGQKFWTLVTAIRALGAFDEVPV